MKISTKGIYALEVITDLAMHSGPDSLESLKNIAERRNLSEKYLERIVKGMKSKGLIISVRGAHGGYKLARAAETITVREVLSSVEGELAPVSCLTEETECRMNCDSCATRETWRGMWEGILEVSESVNIRDIINEIEEHKKSVDEKG